MVPSPESLFALPEVASLLRAEAAFARAHAQASTAGYALVIRPSSASVVEATPAAAVHTTSLFVDDAVLAGDLRCEPDALPWDDGAFRWILAQHAIEMPHCGDALGAELARVLAPGGSLLAFGFNPFSAWSPWRRAHARQGVTAPNALWPTTLRQSLSRHGLEVGELRFLGPLKPRADASDGSIALLRGAYALIATKRRVSATPRPLMRVQPVALQPRLVGTPTQRTRTAGAQRARA